MCVRKPEIGFIDSAVNWCDLVGDFVRFGTMHYLSDEWIVAADEAVRHASNSAPDRRVVIDQHIEGRISYRVIIERDASSIATLDETSDGPVADATFSQSAQTAHAIARGDTDAHQAFLLGKIRFDGDIGLLIERREVFGWLERVLAPVLSKTTF